MRFYKDHLLLHLTVFIWGFTGILGKEISLGQESLVWYRMLIAFLALSIFVMISRTGFKIRFTDLIKLLVTGMVIALHWIFFFGAIKVSNVSIAVLCMATQTIFMSVLEPLILKRRFIPYEIILGIFALAGIAMIYGIETQYTTGIIYGLVSAFFASVFTALNGLFIQKLEALKISTYEMLGGLTGVTVFLLFNGSFNAGFFIVSQSDVLYLLMLGIVCTAVAFLVSVSIMKRLSPFTISISVNLEPIYTIILALIIYGQSERMTPWFYLGGTIIFLTVLVNAMLKGKYQAQEQL